MVDLGAVTHESRNPVWQVPQGARWPKILPSSVIVMAVGAVRFGFSYHDAGGTDGMAEAVRLVAKPFYRFGS